MIRIFNSKKCSLYGIFFFFLLLFYPLLVSANSSALQVVRDYVHNLKAYAESGDIEYRIRLDEITPTNCLVNDIIAQHIAQENGYPAGTLRVADYYNAFEKWRLKGRVTFRVDYLEYQKNIVVPGEMSVLGDTLHVIMGRLDLKGPVTLSDRVMYFVRGRKVTKVISSGDGETLGKGIEYYSNKDYESAFKLFRKLANLDMSNFMAQYWTAIMELNGEGCTYIHPLIRRQEAIWWLSRGRETCLNFLRKSWSEYREQNKSDISYVDYVLQIGDSLVARHFPEVLKLMMDAYSEANITSDEIPFRKRSDYSLLVRNYRPIVNGLMLKIQENTGLHGFVNEKNEEIIPCKYRIAFPFGKNGLTQVYNLDKKRGFINTKGEVVIPCIYDYLGETFLGDIVFAVKDGNLLVLSKKNEVLRKISGYDKLLIITLDKYAVIQNPKTGKGDMFDNMGNIVAYDIDNVSFDINEIYKVMKNGKVIYSCYMNWR